LWGDTNQAGLGLNADTHAKKRGELARLLGHGDNGGTLADADNAARLAVQADDIASTETEWIEGFHLEL
jgi:Zn-dependent M28 family amino/carboxypeptidase